MTRRQALQEYAAIVCQIELLKLKLPPLERILLQTEMGAVKEIAKDAAKATSKVARSRYGNPYHRLYRGRRSKQVLQALKERENPVSCVQLAKECGTTPNTMRSTLQRLVRIGKVKSFQGDAFIMFEAA